MRLAQVFFIFSISLFSINPAFSGEDEVRRFTKTFISCSGFSSMFNSKCGRIQMKANSLMESEISQRLNGGKQNPKSFQFFIQTNPDLKKLYEQFSRAHKGFTRNTFKFYKKKHVDTRDKEQSSGKPTTSNGSKVDL